MKLSFDCFIEKLEKYMKYFQSPHPFWMLQLVSTDFGDIEPFIFQSTLQEYECQMFHILYLEDMKSINNY